MENGRHCTAISTMKIIGILPHDMLYYYLDIYVDIMCGCRKSIKEQRPYIGLHCHCNLWLQLARHTWVKLLWLSLQAKYQKQASNHLRLKNDESMKHYIYFQLKFLHIPIYMIVDCRFVPVVCWSGFCLLLWHFVIWVNKQKVWNFQSYCIALLLFKVTFSIKKKEC